MTKNGDSVESGFGVVQVQVVKSNGKITAVNMLQANATNGRAGAFPYLVQYAIAANGSSFSNLSGATYTTNAFKRSLESALAKF
ncbi:MAG: FMN-binding protein [Micrococcales bacterium]